jgi:diguanylate cyclase (GGDEF)-like protein
MVRVVCISMMVCFLAMVPLCAVASSLSLPDHPHYVFERVGENLGLSTITPTCFLQDSQGFLWIGTQSGLIRFDGSRAVRFGLPEGLPNAFILQMLLGKSGRIYIATQQGVLAYYDNAFHSLSVRAPIGSLTGSQPIALDAAENLYVASQSGLMFIPFKDPNKFHVWPVPAEFQKPQFAVVFTDQDNRTWFAFDWHLGWIDTLGQLRFMPPTSGLPKETIRFLVRDGSYVLWVRTAAHLYRMDAAYPRFWREAPSLPPASDFGSYFLGHDGQLLIPSIAGLYRRTKSGWDVIDRSRGLESNAAVSGIEDREGSYWLGFGGAGIFRWTGRDSWSGWTQNEGLPDNVVWSILRDSRQRLWVATNNGVAMWEADSHHWRIWHSRQDFYSSTVRKLELDSSGAIWALCVPGGLVRFDPNTLQVERIKLEGNGPNDIGRSPDGRFWIGNESELRFLQSPNRPFKFIAPGFWKNSGATASSFSWSTDGALWTAGRQGVFEYDGKAWRHFTNKDLLLENTVSDIVATSKSEAWVQYDDPLGVSRLLLAGDKPTISNFGLSQGLISLDVAMLDRDREGNIWVGGSQGLTQIRPNGSTLRFTRSDGLLWNDLDSFGFYAERDNSILFGTSGGLARYVPETSSEKGDSRFSVVITSAQLGGQERLHDASPTASRRENNLVVQFAPLTFRDPQNVRCSHRLEGIETEYSETSLRELSYSALPPGSYRFIVSCRNQHGSALDAAAFRFTVAPAWWQHWMFRSLITLAMIVLLFAFISFRTRQLQRDRIRLEQAVAERSEELARANRELQEISFTDPLTGARNRRFFQVSIDADVNQSLRVYTSQNPVERNRDLIFYLIDIDHFKEINDRFGHDAGDQLLRDVTLRINSAIRLSDVLIRWGGEEFLVISRFTERAEASILASRVLGAIASAPFEIKGSTIPLSRTCSIGWASFPWIPSAPHVVSAEAVLSLADVALYRAKNGGRNRAVAALPPETGAPPDGNSAALPPAQFVELSGAGLIKP